MLNERSCGTIVFRKNEKVKYLLLHYEEGHWGFPKGHIKPEEKEEEAALRELNEETGIEQVQIVPGFRKEIEYYFTRRGNTIHKDVVYYLTKALEERVELSYEHNDYSWLDFSEAYRMITFDNTRNLLVKAEDYINKIDR